MKSHAAWVSLLVVATLSASLPVGSSAAPTSDHKKQIDEARKEVGKVKALIAKKEFDEAAKTLDDAEQKLKQVAKEAGVDENSKLLAGTFRLIEQNREALAKKRPAVGGAGEGDTTGSFEKDVAPILSARCLNCHGANNPKANLRIDTFAGIVQGCGGAFVVPGKPAESLLIQRITAEGDDRMPKNAAPLTNADIKKISDWITGGAKFTGNNATPIAELKSGAAPAAAKPAFAGPIQINKPTGGETVSFTNDIAPFMVNLCLNCHSGSNPRSGFSLETFEKLMRGGSSGRVVLPGDTKGSRLWDLAGEQYTPDGKPLKMPPGQAMITRTNHRNLRIWIEEGAKFDGPDPKAPLRSLVPTDAEKRARELARLSPEDFAKFRKGRSNQLWSAALPNDSPVEYETDAFLLVGNAPQSRIKQIAEWAGASAERLRKLFKIKDALIWRGKLIVFVFKDRFSYVEFAQTNENVQIPPDTRGHSRVNAAGDEAYICVLDIGDTPSDDSPGVRTLLTGLLAEATLQRSPNRVPDWAAKGTGLVLASQSDSKNPYFRGLSAGAHEALRAIDKADELFANGTFSPADLAPVGFTLVSYMLKHGGEGSFVEFLNQSASGKSVADALKAVYRVDAASLAQGYRAYVDGLPGAKAAAKKKK
jgi:hypothetical protein